MAASISTNNDDDDQVDDELIVRPPLDVSKLSTTLDIQRFDRVYLYRKNGYRAYLQRMLLQDKDNDSDIDMDTHAQHMHYRYVLRVVDNDSKTASTSTSIPTAVLLIPAGRESEYLFASRGGLRSIAKTIPCSRLIAVAFGRNSMNKDMDQQTVQNELTELVQQMQFRGATTTPTTIPFMAMQGVGQRDAITQGETDLSGPYLVEQVQIDDDGRFVRRLYFTRNPFVIQSEVRMKMTEENVVDTHDIAFEYHKTMVASMVTAMTEEEHKNSNKALIIGLGGGGLVTFLQTAATRMLSKVHVIELDPSMVNVATNWFGVRINDDSSNDMVPTEVHVGDGLDVGSATAMKFEPNLFTYIVIDVDAKDSSVGMSCPPAAFCDVAYLQKLYQLLRTGGDGGMLLINVSARDPEQATMVAENVRTVFGDVVYVMMDDDESEHDEDPAKAINVTMVARKVSSELALPTTEDLKMNLDRVFGRDGECVISEDLMVDLCSCQAMRWEDYQQQRQQQQQEKQEEIETKPNKPKKGGKKQRGGKKGKRAR